MYQKFKNNSTSRNLRNSLNVVLTPPDALSRPLPPQRSVSHPSQRALACSYSHVLASHAQPAFMSGLPLLGKRPCPGDVPSSVDDCLEQAGGWGFFQWRLLLTLGMCTAMVAAHMLQPIFLAPLIHWPLSPWCRGAVSSAFFLGYGVGVFFWACVSDKRGRRPTIILSFAIGNLAGILSFLAPNYSVFFLLRLVCGFGVSGTKNAVFLLGTEFCPPSARAKLAGMLAYSWLAGLLVLIATARVLRGASWRYLGLVHAPGLLLQLGLRAQRELPESPRFLLVAGEVERAKEVLFRVFVANGKVPPEPLCLQQPPPKGNEQSAFSQLFR